MKTRIVYQVSGSAQLTTCDGQIARRAVERLFGNRQEEEKEKAVRAFDAWNVSPVFKEPFTSTNGKDSVKVICFLRQANPFNYTEKRS